MTTLTVRVFTTAEIIYRKTVIALVCHLNCSRQETVTMNKTITALAIMMASFAANASVLPETPVPFKSGTEQLITTLSTLV